MIVVFLGAPGSGKGTQAKDVAKEFDLVAISTGDLCRAEIAAKSDLGIKIKETVDKGLLVDDSWIITLLNEAIAKHDKARGFILDGFPRTLKQADMLDAELAEQNLKVDAVVELKIVPEILIERLTNRYQCKSCGATYNKLFKNPSAEGVCDYCGGTEFVTREDDREEVIRKRFIEYTELTAPLIPYYEEQNKLHIVSADKEPEQVYQEICNILKNVLT